MDARSSTDSSEDGYLIAAYVLLPVASLLLLLFCIYALCHNKHRLNWYENTLLEDSHDQTTAEWSATLADDIEKKRGKVTGNITARGNSKNIVTQGSSGVLDYGGYSCGIDIRDCERDRKSVRFHKDSSILEVLKGIRKLTTRFKSLGERDTAVENGNKTEWIVCKRKSLGSSPSSPAHDSTEEKFWVPPEVVHRKRAQSLIPTGTCNDSEEEVSSGTVTPASLGGLREFTYTFQSTPLISSDGLPSPLPHANRQRRASMQDAIDFRKIDSKLYDRRALKRQQSVASIEEDPLGSIHFSLEFNSETCLLTVYLIEAENLVSREFSGTADPYCKVCLLPDKRSQLQSKIHRKTTHPIFDEEFIFEIQPETLQTTSLELLIYDYDQFSRHECIGHVSVPFQELDFNQRHNLWKPVTKVENKCESRNGDVIFSLGYLSSAERLTVVVMKARNLRHVDDGKITMDPYVKVLLNAGNGKKVKKKKTCTQHNMANPVWNEALTFSLPKDYLQQVSLEVIVYHDNKMGSDEILGKTVICQDAKGDERIHWDEMVSNKNAVARWHKLESS